MSASRGIMLDCSLKLVRCTAHFAWLQRHDSVIRTIAALDLYLLPKFALRYALWFFPVEAFPDSDLGVSTLHPTAANYPFREISGIKASIKSRQIAR